MLNQNEARILEDLTRVRQLPESDLNKSNTSNTKGKTDEILDKYIMLYEEALCLMASSKNNIERAWKLVDAMKAGLDENKRRLSLMSAVEPKSL